MAGLQPKVSAKPVADNKSPTTNNKQIMTIISAGVRTRSGKLMMVEHSRVRSYKLAFLSLVSMSMLMMMLICCSTGAVNALSCYNCTSSDDPGCDEAFLARAKFNSTDCKQLVPAGQEPKVCRKIVQHMQDTKVVIRSCGYIDEHHNQQPDKDRKDACFKRSGTFAVTMESCNCYQDGCNHSTTLVPTSSTSLSLLLLLLGSASKALISLWSNNIILTLPQ